MHGCPILIRHACSHSATSLLPEVQHCCLKVWLVCVLGIVAGVLIAEERQSGVQHVLKAFSGQIGETWHIPGVRGGADSKPCACMSAVTTGDWVAAVDMHAALLGAVASLPGS